MLNSNRSLVIQKNHLVPFLSILKEHSALAIFVALGAFLRFKGLTFQSLWFDEIFSVLTATENDFSGIIHTCRFHDVHPPFYYCLLAGWKMIFGIGAWAIRSLSALFGVLGILFIYLLGKELFSKRVGIIASALISFNFFHIYYSQEARSYSFVFLLTILSYLYFVKQIKRPSLIHWILYIIFTTLLLYTHYFALFVFAAQCFYWAFGVLFSSDVRKHIRKATLSSIPVIILFIPWIPTALKGAKISAFWIQQPKVDFIVEYFNVFFGREIFLILLYLIFIMMYFVKRDEKDNFIQHQTILISWVVIGCFLPYIRGFSGQPILTTRNAIVVLPALILMISKGLAAIKERSARVLILLIVVFMSLVNIFYSKKYYQSPLKQQYREVASFVVGNDPDGIFPVYANSSFRYYLNYIFNQ